MMVARMAAMGILLLAPAFVVSTTLRTVGTRGLSAGETIESLPFLVEKQSNFLSVSRDVSDSESDTSGDTKSDRFKPAEIVDEDQEHDGLAEDPCDNLKKEKKKARCLLCQEYKECDEAVLKKNQLKKCVRVANKCILQGHLGQHAASDDQGGQGAEEEEEEEPGAGSYDTYGSDVTSVATEPESHGSYGSYGSDVGSYGSDEDFTIDSETYVNIQIYCDGRSLDSAFDGMTPKAWFAAKAEVDPAAVTLKRDAPTPGRGMEENRIAILVANDEADELASSFESKTGRMAEAWQSQASWCFLEFEGISAFPLDTSPEEEVHLAREAAEQARRQAEMVLLGSQIM